MILGIYSRNNLVGSIGQVTFIRHEELVPELSNVRRRLTLSPGPIETVII